MPRAFVSTALKTLAGLCRLRSFAGMLCFNQWDKGPRPLARTGEKRVFLLALLQAALPKSLCRIDCDALVERILIRFN
jgi:hypothetical protein